MTRQSGNTVQYQDQIGQMQEKFSILDTRISNVFLENFQNHKLTIKVVAGSYHCLRNEHRCLTCFPWFSPLCVACVHFYIFCSSQSCEWKLSNHRDGTPRFDKQRLRVPSSSQPASHLFNPQAFCPDTQDSLVSVKSYRSEPHMQSVSVSGMNYTARDVCLYTR